VNTQHTSRFSDVQLEAERRGKRRAVRDEEAQRRASMRRQRDGQPAHHIVAVEYTGSALSGFPDQPDPSDRRVGHLTEVLASSLCPGCCRDV
jgi:hypothetical protein